MKDPKILHIAPPVQNHRYRHLGWVTQVSFDERDLFIQQTLGLLERRSSYHLHNLSPEIPQERVSDDDAMIQVRRSWLYLLAAVVVYFSAIHPAVPLLAPALALLWAVTFGVNLRQAWPYRWFVIRDEFGAVVTRMRVTDDTEADRTRQELFVRSLGKAIESAKQREYYPSE